MKAMTWRRSTGFSFIELIVSLGLTLIIAAAALAIVGPARAQAQVAPEAADMQQRARVAVQTMFADLLMAGNGPYQGATAGPLVGRLAPILPFRQGLRLADAVGTARSDAITVMYVPQTVAQATIGQPLPARSGDAVIVPGAGCPVGDVACGFAAGMNVLVTDEDGFHDLFVVTSLSLSTLHLQHAQRDTSHTYLAGATIVEVVTRTYYLKADEGAKLYQLVMYEGGSGNDAPVVDHVVGLTFTYYGVPQPPAMARPLSDAFGPWTTYGPKPPSADRQTTGYPAGENCAFSRDAAGALVPRLPVLATAPSLVRLDPSLFIDGPWCADTSDPNRFDADLLRIRKVAVSIRMESAVDALRGPAGVLFTHGGVSRAATRLLPDLEFRFEVTPRNMNLDR